MDIDFRNLRRLRLERELTQAEVSRLATAVSRSPISILRIYNWERGKQEPSARGLAAVLEVLGASIEDLKQ